MTWSLTMLLNGNRLVGWSWVQDGQQVDIEYPIGCERQVDGMTLVGGLSEEEREASEEALRERFRNDSIEHKCPCCGRRLPPRPPGGTT